MAKGKAAECNEGGELDGAKRFFDSEWKMLFNQPLSEWIINRAKSVHNLRKFACFATPDICKLVGNELHFTGCVKGRQARDLWLGNFITVLHDCGLRVHEPPKEKSLLWCDMDERQKTGFAKAIWVKRDFIGREQRGMEKTPFEPEIQIRLCRLAGAPSPESLRQMLEAA